MRFTLLAFVAMVVLAGGPAFVAAEEPEAAAPAASAPDTAPAPAPHAGGCPRSPNGSCCASCQEKAAQGQPAEKAEGGCPCQRARKAAEKQG